MISIIFIIEFLVLPYFMERFVTNCLPGMTMLDYKVDYVNHKKFNSTGWLSFYSKTKSAVELHFY